ncbi:MAG: hypothetical protein SOY38_00665 [Sodaliphilus sp.]|nr:hypothetical protein [Bacteroidales bacterium]MDY4075213.1 hypothetical protein [Sodaliphilus sp.]
MLPMISAKNLMQRWQKNAVQSTPDAPKRRRKRKMSDTEVITILICFHFNSYRNIKHYPNFVIASPKIG